MVMNVIDAIKVKRAVRVYKDTRLPKDVADIILNSGRRAQSSKNSQPWDFIAIQDRDTLVELSKCGEWAGHIAGAAMAVALLSPDSMAKFQTMFDIGQCAAYMQLAAWELGVGSCSASIYEPEKARQILGFPANFHLRIVLSFGYPLDQDVLSAPPKRGGRKPLADSVHWDKW